ncbi:hypothetical protein [Pedomonas mirosovicensis]|uniref:hypothetical protein n=1 Tax=Pedomonas mirosovicensis TaxID=2908641 RepID=UPI0021678BAB|nr:hypothetical protein [Pedomonas mirosovicensis]MCH8683901.1 hypothetical protein [Pedomonas mirosovicensis]
MRLGPLAFLARRLGPLLRRRPRRETVLFTEDHLVLVWPQRGEEAVAWDAISHIALRRMEGAAGPEGLFVYVVAGRERLVIPPSADNRQALLGFVRGLPACDTATFDRVLAGVAPETVPAGLVTVWRRPGG